MTTFEQLEKGKTYLVHDLSLNLIIEMPVVFKSEDIIGYSMGNGRVRYLPEDRINNYIIKHIF